MSNWFATNFILKDNNPDLTERRLAPFLRKAPLKGPANSDAARTG